MSQNIHFPDITINKLAADLTVGNTPQKVLFVGQRGLAGTAPSGELITEIPNDNSWDTLFGLRSTLAASIRAFRQINTETRVDVIPFIRDGSGVAASSIITFVVDGGSATTAGIIDIVISSSIRHDLKIAVEVGDTATILGNKLVLATVDDDNIEIVLDTNIAGVVTFNSSSAGTIGNNLPICIISVVDGVTVTITAFSGGVIDPDVTDVFDVIGDTRYQTIVWPGTWDTTELTTLLDSRFNADGQILDGAGILSITEDFADSETFVEGFNDQSIWVEINKLEDTTICKGGAMLETKWVRSAQFAAVRSLRLTSGANITNLTVTNAPKDQVGGPSIATLPYANTPFPNLPVIATGLGFIQSEIKQLRTAGGFVYGNNLNNTGVILGEVVSTYKTDAVGNPDLSFKFGNFVDTISNVAEYFFNNLRSDFKSSRLTLGDLKDGFSMENKKSLTAQIIRYYQDLTGPVFLLLQDGEDARKFFVKNLKLDVDLLTGTVTFSAKVPIITQIRVITGNIQLAFDINDLAIAA